MREIVAIIPARGGSKGIPGKNIKPLLGKPLIVHTIEHAIGADAVTRIIVSTDDDEITKVGLQAGAEVMRRPSALSGDTASSELALLHVLESLDKQENYVPDLVVFLQCTSPMRQPYDIDEAVATLDQESADSLLSVSPSHRFLWQVGENGAEALNYDPLNRPRRQEMFSQYVENGSIYVFKPTVLHNNHNRLGGKIALYVMDEAAGIDIDTPYDLALCEWVAQQQIL